MPTVAKYGASIGKWIRNALRQRPRDAIEKTWINDDPTFGYRPTMRLQAETIIDELPFFRLQTARLMLRDPVIRIGLTCRNAALSAAQIQVECKDARVREWIGKQWQFLWNHYRTALLRAKVYGHSGLQLELERNRDTNTIDICGLKEFAPEDVRPLSYGGRVAAFRVRSAANSPVLLPPRGVWLSFDDDAGQPGGASILKRSYSPWWEKHMPGGAVKTRQLRLIKDAYIGDVLQFPWAESVDDAEGNPIPWRDIVRSISEARLAGATIVIPRKMDAEGNEQITYTPPQDTGTPTGIYQWVDDLDRDIWRGLDVFEEVIQAADTGSGFSGRSVPLTMFLAGCGEELTQIVKCLDEFTFAPLVYWNFGPNIEYDITVVPLVKTFSQDMGGSPMGGEAMGGQAGSRPPGGQPPPPQQGQPAKQGPPKPKQGPQKNPTQFYEPAESAESEGIATLDYATSDAIASRTVAALRSAMTLHPSEIAREISKQRTTSKRLRGREALAMVLGVIPLLMNRKVRIAQEIAEDGLLMASVAGAAAAQATIEREAELSQTAIEGSPTARELILPPAVETAPTVDEISVPTFVPQGPDTLEDRPPVDLPEPVTQPEIPKPPRGRVPSTESLFGRRKRVRFPNEIRARKKLRDSTALAGLDYRHTAQLVREDAFAITTRMGDDVIAHLRDALKKNMHEGMDLKSFIQSVEKIQRGQEFPLSRARIELVFRANTARYLSDAADAALNNPIAADQFPYRAYSATHDDRVRDEHLRVEQSGLNGTNVFRYDDPAWKAFRPPWAYNCRCWWRPVSVRQAARIGVVEANNWLARATARANSEGGLADQYLARVKPASGEMVPWPTIDGESLYPSPEWNRTGVQFGEPWGKFDVATPTDAQKEAGNYRKGHVTWNGLNIAIENPRGSVRKGDGWRAVMKSHYGYIKSTEGKDGDHVDVFLGPHPTSEVVYVVNQTDKQGRFDEHKVMIGWYSADDAKAGYLANYPVGWKCGPVVAMTVRQFKKWLENGNTTKPCCEQFAEIQRGLFGDEFDVESKPAKPQKKTKPESTERQGMLWTGLDLKPGQRDFLDEQGDAITEDTRKADSKPTPAKDAGFESKHPRAPEGGATVKGKKYDGGEFIPAKTLEHLAKQTRPIGLRDLGEAVGMRPGPSHDPLKSPLNRALVTLTDQGLIQAHESKSGFGEPGISLTDKGREHVKKQERSAVETEIAKRFKIPTEAASDLLNVDIKELQRRDEYLSPSNTTEPTTDYEKFPIGTAKVDSVFKDNPDEAYIEFLREVDVDELNITEPEDGIKKSETYKRYVQWFKDGIEPPPVFVAERDDGKLNVTNRRRTLAAKEAGVKKLKAWFSPMNRETGNPLKYGDIKKAASVQFREAAQSGWITLGGGASVFVSNGRILEGCPGLKGQDITDLIDESDASRAKRKKRQDKAESLGITGEEVSIDDLEKLDDGELPADDDSFDFGATATDPDAVEADPVDTFITQAHDYAIGLGYGPEVLGIDRDSASSAMSKGTPPEAFAQQRIDDWMAQFQPGQKTDKANRKIRKGTKLYRDIKESLAADDGSEANEDDVQYFGAVLLDVLSMRQEEAIQWNDTRRQMLYEMGLSDNMAAARIAREISRGKDATQLKRFDEIRKVLDGERGDRYRVLFRATQSESEGRDDTESLLMEALNSQQRKVPTLQDEEVWSEAFAATEYALSRAKTYDPDEEAWKSVEFSEPKHWALYYWDYRAECLQFAEQQMLLFDKKARPLWDEDEHPRATQGSRDPKYKGGRFVPKLSEKAQQQADRRKRESELRKKKNEAEKEGKIDTEDYKAAKEELDAITKAEAAEWREQWQLEKEETKKFAADPKNANVKAHETSMSKWVGVQLHKWLQEAEPDLRRLKDHEGLLNDFSSDRLSPEEIDKRYEKLKPILRKYRGENRKRGEYKLFDTIWELEDEIKHAQTGLDSADYAKIPMSGNRWTDESTRLSFNWRKEVLEAHEAGHEIAEEALDAMRWDPQIPESLKTRYEKNRAVKEARNTANDDIWGQRKTWAESIFAAPVAKVKTEIEPFTSRVKAIKAKWEKKYDALDDDQQHVAIKEKLAELGNAIQAKGAMEDDDPLAIEWKNTSEELAKSYNRIWEARRDIESQASEEFRNEFIKSFAPQQKAVVSIGENQISDVEFNQRLKKVTDFIGQITGRDAVESLKINVKQMAEGVTRASCGGDTINVSAVTNESTIAHEIGHAIEHADDSRIAEISRGYLANRVSNDPHGPQHMGDHYDDHEVGWDDKFQNRYIGKLYHYATTEILSMGVQYLYENALEFSQKDPDHFAYTVAALRGDL